MTAPNTPANARGAEPLPRAAPAPGDSPESLRAQAAACRRLAAAAPTRSGRSSLGVLADHFDAQAARLDAAAGPQ